MGTVRVWFVALLVSGVCLGLPVVPVLPGQEAGNPPAPPFPPPQPGRPMGLPGPMGPAGRMWPPAWGPFEEAQQQVNHALGRYASTEDETEREAIKVDLTKALQRQFEIQQQRRMAELAEIENWVQKLRELIEKRNQAKETIIAKRCDQLLSEIDGLGWTSPEGKAPPPIPMGRPGVGMPGTPGGLPPGPGIMTKPPGMPAGAMPGMGGGSDAGSAGGPRAPAAPGNRR